MQSSLGGEGLCPIEQRVFAIAIKKEKARE
jgi:hypothetical protein